MTRSTPDQLGGANRCAFLDAIAFSEIGTGLLVVSDDGYNIIVGSTPTVPILFSDYSVHPHHEMSLGHGLTSDAAGRYQFMGRYWEAYQAQLHLPDFGPLAQDTWGIQLVRECHALALVDAGQVAQALTACKSRWASIPGAGYGQHENTITDLVSAYVAAGGTVA